MSHWTVRQVKGQWGRHPQGRHKSLYHWTSGEMSGTGLTAACLIPTVLRNPQNQREAWHTFLKRPCQMTAQRTDKILCSHQWKPTYTCLPHKGYTGHTELTIGTGSWLCQALCLSFSMWKYPLSTLSVEILCFKVPYNKITLLREGLSTSSYYSLLVFVHLFCL